MSCSPGALASLVLEAIEPGPINSPGTGGEEGQAGLEGTGLWVGSCGGGGEKEKEPRVRAQFFPQTTACPSVSQGPLCWAARLCRAERASCRDCCKRRGCPPSSHLWVVSGAPKVRIFTARAPGWARSTLEAASPVPGGFSRVHAFP